MNTVFITSFATPLVMHPSAVLKRNFNGFHLSIVITCMIICAAKKMPVSWWARILSERPRYCIVFLGHTNRIIIARASATLIVLSELIENAVTSSNSFKVSSYSFLCRSGIRSLHACFGHVEWLSSKSCRSSDLLSRMVNYVPDFSNTYATVILHALTSSASVAPAALTSTSLFSTNFLWLSIVTCDLSLFSMFLLCKSPLRWLWMLDFFKGRSSMEHARQLSLALTTDNPLSRNSFKRSWGPMEFLFVATFAFFLPYLPAEVLIFRGLSTCFSLVRWLWTSRNHDCCRPQAHCPRLITRPRCHSDSFSLERTPLLIYSHQNQGWKSIWKLSSFPELSDLLNFLSAIAHIVLSV